MLVLIEKWVATNSIAAARERQPSHGDRHAAGASPGATRRAIAEARWSAWLIDRSQFAASELPRRGMIGVGRKGGGHGRVGIGRGGPPRLAWMGAAGGGGRDRRRRWRSVRAGFGAVGGAGAGLVDRRQLRRGASRRAPPPRATADRPSARWRRDRLRRRCIASRSARELSRLSSAPTTMVVYCSVRRPGKAYVSRAGSAARRRPCRCCRAQWRGPATARTGRAPARRPRRPRVMPKSLSWCGRPFLRGHVDHAADRRTWCWRPAARVSWAAACNRACSTSLTITTGSREVGDHVVDAPCRSGRASARDRACTSGRKYRSSTRMALA